MRSSISDCLHPSTYKSAEMIRNRLTRPQPRSLRRCGELRRRQRCADPTGSSTIRAFSPRCQPREWQDVWELLPREHVDNVITALHLPDSMIAPSYWVDPKCEINLHAYRPVS